METCDIPGYISSEIIENPHHANTGDLKLKVNCKNTGFISDGYHTFDELYKHRILLYLALLKASPEFTGWKAQKHHDGTSYDGWFLVGCEVDGKQISYHLPDSYWELARLPEYEFAPVKFDGHSSNDVLDRLIEWIEK